MTFFRAVGRFFKEQFSLPMVNPLLGKENCVACTLAAIKTMTSGRKYFAAPDAPTETFDRIVKLLGIQHSLKVQQLVGRYWHTEAIERWLDMVYPVSEAALPQHFFIAVAEADDHSRSGQEVFAHALYGFRYRDRTKGEIVTKVLNTQNGSSVIKKGTFSKVGATIINPSLLTSRVLNKYRVFRQPGASEIKISKRKKSKMISRRAT